MSHRQRLTLLAVILGFGVVTIDGTIVSVALPAIERALGDWLSGQQWVSNAYLLALASLILIGGSLGDINGERRVFAFGIAAFGVLSVACALAPTIETLIAARALQGAAGALVTPSSLAIIVAARWSSLRGARIPTSRSANAHGYGRYGRTWDRTRERSQVAPAGDLRLANSVGSWSD